MPSDFSARSDVGLRAILLNDFWFKFLGTSAFMGLFFWAYLFLLKNPAFPVTTIPLTIVDQWVGFAPLALVPYLSLWIYCALPVHLMPTRVRLLNFGFWIGAMCLLALSIFYWLPNAVPPANIDWSSIRAWPFSREWTRQVTPAPHCTWRLRCIRVIGCTG